MVFFLVLVLNDLTRIWSMQTVDANATVRRTTSVLLNNTWKIDRLEGKRFSSYSDDWMTTVFCSPPSARMFTWSIIRVSASKWFDSNESSWAGNNPFSSLIAVFSGPPMTRTQPGGIISIDAGSHQHSRTHVAKAARFECTKALNGDSSLSEPFNW